MMETRGLKYRGFFTDDAAKLQVVLDEEHKVKMVERKKQLAAERFAQRQHAGLQRKRMVMDKLLHEEIDEVTSDRKLTVWISAVTTDTTPVATVRAEINSSGALE